MRVFVSFIGLIVRRDGLWRDAFRERGLRASPNMATLWKIILGGTGSADLPQPLASGGRVHSDE